MKESVLIFCDNDISHNIPLTGIADILEKKEYQVLFCGGSKNRSYFESRNIEYRVIEAFNQIKSNVKNDVDMGFFELNFLDAITNKEFKSIENIKPSMVLLPYYISYLFPFLKKKYFEVKFCCVNILLRGELFTPEYLFNFHYSALDSISKKKIAQILGKVEINLNNVIRDYYIDFKEFILCPKELDISDKFIGQNVEYSEAIVGNPKEYTEDLNKNNLIIFSMGSNSHLFPLVINSLVEKIVQCAILLKCYDQSFEMILSIPDGVLNPSVKGLCKRKNLELVNWFDQNDLLSKAKVMITVERKHCPVEVRRINGNTV